MWNLMVRNTFFQVTVAHDGDGDFNSRTRPRSKSVPAEFLFESASADDDSASTGTSPSLDDSEISSASVMEQTLPSLGSELHAEGKCVPCSFFSKQRCRFEGTCKYCHSSHPGQLRPNKRTRERRKGAKAEAPSIKDM
jgi:hypothetical protein